MRLVSKVTAALRHAGRALVETNIIRMSLNWSENTAFPDELNELQDELPGFVLFSHWLIRFRNRFSDSVLVSLCLKNKTGGFVLILG